MKQQIVISGFGGQGVVFITKLITETAVFKGLSVLASETHGMAQRGGNVVSHIKVYDAQNKDGRFWSPLIQSGNADILIALHPESIPPYRHLLKEGGIIICNSPVISDSTPPSMIVFDATSVASRMGNHRMANVILIGFAAAKGYLFCSPDDLIEMLKKEGEDQNQGIIKAIEIGARES
ncbi:MAG: 2-oxoacid:acceptor oxidoreductase family protein [Thermodesulforhabdaceae bacterium]